MYNFSQVCWSGYKRHKYRYIEIWNFRILFTKEAWFFILSKFFFIYSCFSFLFFFIFQVFIYNFKEIRYLWILSCLFYHYSLRLAERERTTLKKIHLWIVKLISWKPVKREKPLTFWRKKSFNSLFQKSIKFVSK